MVRIIPKTVKKFIKTVAGPLAKGTRTDAYGRKIAKLEKEYREKNLGLPDTGIFSEEDKQAYNNLVKNKAVDVGVFKDKSAATLAVLQATMPPVPTGTLAAPEKAAYDTAVAAATAAELVRDQIKTCFEPSPIFKNAQNNYIYDVRSFEKELLGIPSDHTAEGLVSFYRKKIDAAHIGINTQQKSEIDKLSALFDPDPADTTAVAASAAFKTQLILAHKKKPTDPDLTNAEIKQIKANMTADLQKSHSEQKTEFEKHTTEPHNKLTKAMQQQESEITLMHDLLNNKYFLSNKNKDEFEKALANIKPNQKSRNMSITVGKTKNGKHDKYSGLSLGDIEAFHSLTGTVIAQTKTPGGDTLSMTLSHRILNPLFYADRRENPLTDMKLMAEILRRRNPDPESTITMTVDFEDTDTSKYRAQQAYEACILAGYPKDKIKIMEKGKEWNHTNAGELFSNRPERYKNINTSEQSVALNKKNIAQIKSNPVEQKVLEQEHGKAVLLDKAANPSLGG